MKIAKEIFTILCDDIRQEIGNKISLMGVYGKDIVVPFFPFTFPKLCLWMVAKEVQNELDGMRIQVTINAGTPINVDMPNLPPHKPSQDMQIGVTINNLKVDGESTAMIDLFIKGTDKPLTLRKFNIIAQKQP